MADIAEGYYFAPTGHPEDKLKRPGKTCNPWSTAEYPFTGEIGAWTKTKSFAGFLDGETDAFREIIRRYERPVLAFVGNLVRDHHACEEIARGCFLRGLPQHLDRFDSNRASFATWLFTIARNRSAQGTRRGRSGGRNLSLAENQASHVQISGTEERELFLAVDRGLDDLPTPERMAFVMVEFSRTDRA